MKRLERPVLFVFQLFGITQRGLTLLEVAVGFYYHLTSIIVLKLLDLGKSRRLE